MLEYVILLPSMILHSAVNHRGRFQEQTVTMTAQIAPPSSIQKSRQRQLKFELILSKAAALFNWQGSGATTLSDVAGSIGLTKTCLYYYVENKQDLVYQCYVASCENCLDKAFKASLHSGSGRDKLAAMITAHLRHYAVSLRDQAPHYAMLAETSSLDPLYRQDIDQRIKRIFRSCKAIVEDGISDGSIACRDTSVVTMAIFSIVQWFPVWLHKNHAVNIDYVVEMVLDIIFNGLFSEPYQHIDRENRFIRASRRSCTPEQGDGFNKREAFSRVGSSFFNQKGYRGTSLDEIASALAVTKGSFYYHIKSKEELLYQCFVRTLDVEAELLSAVQAEELCGAKKLEHALFGLVNVQIDAQGPLIRYRLLPSLKQQHRKQVLKASKKNANILGDFIRLGLQDGTLCSVDSSIAQHILGGVVEAAPDLLESISFINEWDILEEYLSIFINGLSPKS